MINFEEPGARRLNEKPEKPIAPEHRSLAGCRRKVKTELLFASIGGEKNFPAPLALPPGNTVFLSLSPGSRFPFSRLFERVLIPLQFHSAFFPPRCSLPLLGGSATSDGRVGRSGEISRGNCEHSTGLTGRVHRERSPGTRRAARTMAGGGVSHLH